ncbi:MAG: tetratricopeptide repeat protein, partial [Deltaproteobacteria bacterium]|nr:tetratricopeptide repeat protein [Deltaproteobacteria bacterium]
NLVRSGKREKALKLLLDVPKDGHDEKSLYALGKIYFLEGDNEQAREYLERADTLVENNTRIIEALFEIDNKEGRLDESYQRIQEAMIVHPNSGPLFYLRGMVSLLEGEQNLAENDFRQAIYLSPNDMRAYQGLAAILGRSDRRQEVIDTYETALRAKPEGAAGIYLMVGTLYEMSGLKMKAIERYGQALALDPNLAPAQNNLAYLLADTDGDLDRALELAQAAKAQIPEDPSVADTLGWVLYKKGISSAAITYLQEAASGLPVGSAALGMVQYHLALAYELNGDKEQATEVLTEALAAYEGPKAQALTEGATIVDPNWVKEAQEALRRIQESS